MLSIRTAFLLIASLSAACAALAQNEPATGVLAEQVSDHYAAMAESDTLTQRVVSPIEWDRITRFQDAGGARLKRHTVDLSKERFDLFVPKLMPAQGYGVLVFVSPSPEWPVPRDWKPVLERAGLIYVSARKSGNDQDVLDRRIPLALHALELVRQRYRTDPEHLYVSGFSGGARVANRIARAFPDLFAGAVLMAGSDPLGIRGSIIPERSVMERYQAHSRIVFATGQNDLPNRAQDEHTLKSFQPFCVQGAKRMPQRRLDHWIPDGRGFRAVVDALLEPVADDQQLASCRAALQRRIDAGLATVEQLIAGNRLREAGEKLGTLDDLYGGLAAPGSVALARRLSALLQSSGRNAAD